MSERTIEHKAEKKQTLTLDEVAAFVQDAMRAGAHGTEHVVAEVAFSGKVKKLTVDVQVPANPASLDTSASPKS